MSIKFQLRSVGRLKERLSAKNIRVSKRDREDMNSTIALINNLISENDNTTRYMLETCVIWMLRQIMELKKDDNLTFDPEYFVKFVVKHVDDIISNGKEVQLQDLKFDINNRIFLQGGEMISDDYVNDELEPLILDIINFNRMHHDYRINANRRF
jgi:hypothetical protein